MPKPKRESKARRKYKLKWQRNQRALNRADYNRQQRDLMARRRELETRSIRDSGILIKLSRQTHSVVNASQLQRPLLKYIDAAGRVHTEDLRSAEQLIKEWQHAQTKKDL